MNIQKILEQLENRGVRNRDSEAGKAITRAIKKTRRPERAKGKKPGEGKGEAGAASKRSGGG